MRDEVTEEMVTIIHDALYPGDREDRMTWPRGIFDVAQALAAAGFGDVRAAKAQAWDEGFKQGGPMHDEHYGEPNKHTINPYIEGAK